jgi:3-methyladenine DNA glycosylase AlkD
MQDYKLRNSMKANTAKHIATLMESMSNEEQRQVLMRFFKTGKGEYGEGDEFLGLKVPQTRKVVKQAKDLPTEEIKKLIYSRWHEVRLCGFLILVSQFERLAKKRLEDDKEAAKQRDKIVNFYISNAQQANNWDLVDMSAPKILGHWLMLPIMHNGVLCDHREYKIEVLDRLADSDNLWLKRISMVCTWKTTQMGDPSWCLRYAEKHLHHTHDLMHKAVGKRGKSQARLSYSEREQARLMSMAVGWMLREMGKRVSVDLLRSFLAQHAHEMPRTALRYAIEKLSDAERQEWMQQK